MHDKIKNIILWTLAYNISPLLLTPLISVDSSMDLVKAGHSGKYHVVVSCI
jgi:hypothetical protein